MQTHQPVTDFLEQARKALFVNVDIRVDAAEDTVIWSIIPVTKDDAAVIIGPGGSIANGLRAVVEMAGRRLKRNYILDVSGEPSS